MINMASRYTPEFKQKAVELYLASDATYAQISQELGIDKSTLATWVRAAGADGTAKTTNTFKLEEDLRRLKAENKRLKTENEILLKASAFFASKQM